MESGESLVFARPGLLVRAAEAAERELAAVFSARDTRSLAATEQAGLGLRIVQDDRPERVVANGPGLFRAGDDRDVNQADVPCRGSIDL